MTTRRSYSCNLCHGIVIDGTGVGLRWGARNSIELMAPSNAETHICQGCIDALTAALNDQREHEKVRSLIDIKEGTA